VSETYTGCEMVVAEGLRTRANPRFVEGLPLFVAPWAVASYKNVSDEVVWYVTSGEGFMIIPPGEHNQDWCEALVRSRNSGTVGEDLTYQMEMNRRALEGARAEVDRVRSHFQREMDGVMKTNRSLQTAIVEARKTGSTLLLPDWCQPDDE
jgi:hypothetical protein